MMTTIDTLPSNFSYETIDLRAARFYMELSRRGIPLDEKAMIEIRRDQSRHAQVMLADVQNAEKFKPDPFEVNHYDRIAKAHSIYLPRTNAGQIRIDEKTVLRLGARVPSLVKMTHARKALRFVTVITNLLQRMKNGRIYPTYKLDPELGRVHAGGDANPMNWEPFLQKLVRMEEFQIVEASYERMDLNVLATLSGDTTLQHDLRSGIQVYRIIAEYLFKEQNPARRYLEMAKAVTFSTIYAQTHKALASQINTTAQEAQHLSERWAHRYHRAVAYLRDLADLGRTKGKATSYHGREKEIPQDEDLDYQIRLAANSPIQNTGGDLAKIGFCNLYEDPRTEEWGGEILTTVHDSVISAWPKKLSPQQIRQLHLENLVGKNDPKFGFSVLVKSGPSWGDVEPVPHPAANVNKN